MKNNLFENAYFGKPFMTRTKEKALYHNAMPGGKHYLITSHSGFIVDDSGKSPCSDDDIISEWSEESNPNKPHIITFEAYNEFIDKYGGLMEEKLKKVSFEVAKALKAAGYPQYPIIPSYQDDILKKFIEKREDLCDNVPTYFCPAYLEVWPWLWREKRIFIEPSVHFNLVKGYYVTAFIIGLGDNVSKHIETSGIEEAIITAIDYLVESNLIK